MSLVDDLSHRWPITQVARDQLLAAIVEQLAGARMIVGRAAIDIDGDEVGLDVQSDADRLALIAPTAAIGDLTITLRGRVGTPRRGPSAREVAASYTEADVAVFGDEELIAAWLDPPVREALPQLYWVTDRTALCAEVTVGGGQVSGRPVSLSTQHLAAVADVVAALATRPARLARELEVATAGLDGRLTGPTWGLGDGFAIDLPGGARIDFVRQRGRLETRIRLPAGALTGPTDLGARIRDRAAQVRKLAAAAYQLIDGELVIRVDGVIADRVRLGDALALARRLVGATATAGPYR